MAETIRYQTTGALNPGSPSYIRRAADDDIWDNLEAGEFCYVLAPRQMGKSSLLWQTVGRLRASGVCVATANIQGMGDSITEAEFYEGIIDQLVTTAAKNAGFQMPFDWSTWWDQQSGPFSQRFVTFLREAFLKSTGDEQRWVIAIDEIDATISLPFTDSFFTAIRTCHDFRPGEPMFRRLSVILLGVATPDSLIKDRTRTPFNVGRQVDLRPFSDSEALPLAKGLPLSSELNASALQRVMYWTQGQPHLTQDACDALAKLWRKEPRPTSEQEVESAVDGLIYERYLNAATRGENPHLDYIEQRRVANFPKKTALLRTYLATLREPGVSDDRQSGVAAELKISGLARRDSQGFLKVANRIYATVFDEKWARSNVPNNWPVIRAVAAGVVALLIAVGSEYGYRRPEALAAQLAEASGDLELARKNYVTLQGYPFYGKTAVREWGGFQVRRFEQAVAMDEQAIEAGSRERQADALKLAESARKELEECPGEKWKKQASELWQNFQKKRLLAAIKLDEASWVAFDNLASSAADDAKKGPNQDSSEPEKLRLQEAQRNAYELAQQAHAAFNQPEAMAQFYDRRAERAEAHEHLEGGVLWRLASLKEVDAPKNRRAVTHLIGPDYAPLVHTWGQSVPNSEGVMVCQLFKNETRLLIGAGNELKVCDFESGNVLETFRHDADIEGAQLSVDQSRVLTWTTDGVACAWEFGNSKPIAVLRHPARDKDAEKARPPRITSALFGTSGNRVVTIGDDRTARMWDVTRSELLQTFNHIYTVRGAIISRNEFRVLTWSDNPKVGSGDVQLWDVTRTEALLTFKHSDPVVGAAFNRDESRVLTWSRSSFEGGEARLWDVTKPEPLRTFKHDSFVRGATFSRDESRVLTWSDDQTARLWDVTKPEPLQTFKHDDYVRGALFSRDESRVLTWSDDNTARLWDVTKPEPLQTFKHDFSVNGALFSRDESRVLTWSDDQFGSKGEARLWDVTKPEPLQTFKHTVLVIGALFSRDESRVLTWSYDKTARLWDVTKPEPLQTFKHDSDVRGALFSRYESRVLTWSDDNTARLWDVTKPEPLQTFKHDWRVSGALFSRDESRVLTWSGDPLLSIGEVRLWDLTKSEPLQIFKHDGWVYGALFSRDESRVLTWSGDPLRSIGEVRLWDLTKSEPLQTFKHDNWVRRALFSRDESRVLTWSDDKTARLWDVTKPEPLQTFKHDRFVIGALFSRDESRVLTWSDDKTARLWDVTKPAPLQTFKHDRFVLGALFSRDESRVLTWSNDKTARLWDLTKAEPLQTFKVGDAVWKAEFTGDESGLRTWSTNWVHQLPLAEGTVRHSRRVAGRILNPPKWNAEQRRFSVARDWPGGGAFSIQSLSWDDYDEPPIKGEPAVFLKEWPDKFGQAINEVGDVLPLRPLPVRRREAAPATAPGPPRE